MSEKTFKQNVRKMKAMADLLIPHTFPKVSFEDEKEIVLFKEKIITIDGYEILLCFSRADYGKHFLESLQIQSYLTPFLPFNLVCKIAKEFLGKKNLSYIEFLRNNRKVYCWTIKTRKGRSLPIANPNFVANFEGLEFNILPKGTIDLF
jgi:hypothetical protein